MKRIYSFRVGQHPKAKKVYTFFAKHSISRSNEYPFKVAMSETIEAVVIPDNTQQLFSVIVEAEDVTCYPLDKADIVEAYRVDDTSIKGLSELSTHEIAIENAKTALDISTQLLHDDSVISKSTSDTVFIHDDNLIANDFLKVGQYVSVDAISVRNAQRAMLIDQGQSIELRNILDVDLYVKGESKHNIPIYDARVTWRDSSHELPFVYDSSVVKQTAILLHSEVIYGAEETDVVSSQAETVTESSAIMKIDASSLGEIPLLADVVKDERFMLYACTADEIKMDDFASLLTIKAAQFSSDLLLDTADMLLASEVLKDDHEKRAALILTSAKSAGLSHSVVSVLDVEDRSLDHHLHTEKDLYTESIVIGDAGIHGESVDVTTMMDLDGDIIKNNTIDAADLLLNDIDYTSNEVQVHCVNDYDSEEVNIDIETVGSSGDSFNHHEDTQIARLVKVDTTVDKGGMRDALLHDATSSTKLDAPIDSEITIIDGNNQYAIDTDEIKETLSKAHIVDWEAENREEQSFDEADYIFITSNVCIADDFASLRSDVEAAVLDIANIKLIEHDIIASTASQDHSNTEFLIEASGVNFVEGSSKVDLQAEEITNIQVTSEAIESADVMLDKSFVSTSTVETSTLSIDNSTALPLVFAETIDITGTTNKLEMGVVINDPDNISSEAVLFTELNSPNSIVVNAVHHTDLIVDDVIKSAPVIGTEAIKLTEAEWLTDLPAYVIDATTSDKVEEIENKKRIWLISARANWYSKWFNKKTR